MIRKIRRDDIRTCLDWYNSYIAESTATFETEQVSCEEFTERVEEITSRYPWIVLEEDGALKGYAYLGPFMKRSAYDWTAEISLYLNPDEQGKGYGTQLLEEIIRIARDNGYRNLLSIVTSENSASIRMHEKSGFEQCGELKHSGYKFDRWLSVLFFSLDLNPDTDVTHSPFSGCWNECL